MYINITPKYLPAIKIMMKLLKVIIFIFIIALLSLSALTIYNTKYSPYQAEFIKGSVPKSLPNGFYKGSSPDLPTGTWLGKRFDGKSASGANVFNEGSASVEHFPFRMSKTGGIRDQGLPVIRIDYNLPENPFWLHPAIDEIVEVAPNKFLGKIHYRYTRDNSFVIGYFWQEK